MTKYKGGVISIKDNTTYQKCKGCLKEFPLNANYYHHNNGYITGYNPKCKPCLKELKVVIKKKNERYKNLKVWTCNICKIEYPLTKEYFHKRTELDIGFNKTCKTCKYNEPSRVNRITKKDDLDLMLRDRIHGTKARSNQKNLEFNLDQEFLKELWISQDGKCAISGIQMTHQLFVGRLPTTLSIDRIDCKKGYTKDNIQLLCNYVNFMKSTRSQEELIEYCKIITEYNER
jgi:hypothetical protein